MRRLVMLMAAVACMACSTLSYTVDNDAFASMSIDKKMRLFDAENDVSIAEDEREQMRERVRQIRQDIRDAHKQAHAAEQDADNHNDAALAHRAEVMWAARVRYLEESLDYMRDRIDVQQAVILVARAKFELAKVLLIKKNKLPGAESLNVLDYEKQVAQVSQRAKTALSELDKSKPHLARVRLEWLKLRDDVAASSLSALSTPGEDEMPVWESW